VPAATWTSPAARLLATWAVFLAFRLCTCSSAAVSPFGLAGQGPPGAGKTYAADGNGLFSLARARGVGGGSQPGEARRSAATLATLAYGLHQISRTSVLMAPAILLDHLLRNLARIANG
jgi:hypothetical protein